MTYRYLKDLNTSDRKALATSAFHLNVKSITCLNFPSDLAEGEGLFSPFVLSGYASVKGSIRMLFFVEFLWYKSYQKCHLSKEKAYRVHLKLKTVCFSHAGVYLDVKSSVYCNIPSFVYGIEL